VHDPLDGRKSLDVLNPVRLGKGAVGFDAQFLHAVGFPIGLSPPQEGVGPEKEEGPGQKPGHEDKGPEQGGIILAVPIVRMGLVVHEPGVKALMAATAVRDEIVGMNAGTRIALGQDVVGGVAVPASGDAGGIAYILDLPVIGFLVIADEVGR